MAKEKKKKVKKVSGASRDVVADNIDTLKRLFPQVFKDGKIDPDALKLAFGKQIETDSECYGLNWTGKCDCFGHIKETTTATLKPDRKESVDFDNTENIFIEGDNLEVLKVLQKNYSGKVKMIYIDPPYNTGNDSFIYPDRFKEEKADYEERAGIKDAEGLLTKDGFFRKNSKDTGHFHSNWLCMMYPRLFLAKNLLSQDGAIFVSIDDNEVHNLRMIMNEIFGEENFLSNMVWEGAIKNDSKFTSISHDYILCYAKALDQLKENDGRWRTHKKGIDKIYKKVEELKKEFANRYELIAEKLGEWFSSLPKKESAWQHRHYCKIDEKGVYFPGDISWPGGGGPKYEIIHPKTKKPVRIPSLGWRFAKKETMLEAISDRRIDFGIDENKVPTIKRYLHETEGQVLPSVFYQDRRAAMQRLRRLMGGDIFENPKDESVLMKLAEACSSENDIILDFFAGSCTTAHAVMALNAEDGGNRKYICVQLAEPCDEKSEAFKAGYKTIADIGKERIRRAGKKIKKENTGKLDFDGSKLDLGLKVFGLDESNFKQWRADIKTGEELKEQMKMFVDNKKKGSAPEDMLYEIILKNSRFDLNVPIEKMTFDGIDYYVLATEGTEHTENSMEIICLADKITKKLAEKILKEKPQKFTCLDTAFKNNDQLKTNTALQMEAEKIEFKVI